mmetsp:Transcript_40/g.103  ORF Transcript_40/g.103 Transcript_40/m.103 type:complete len:219 (-) Transcript_40:443-1099(-)
MTDRTVRPHGAEQTPARPQEPGGPREGAAANSARQTSQPQGGFWPPPLLLLWRGAAVACGRTPCSPRCRPYVPANDRRRQSPGIAPRPRRGQGQRGQRRTERPSRHYLDHGPDPGPGPGVGRRRRRRRHRRPNHPRPRRRQRRHSQRLRPQPPRFLQPHAPTPPPRQQPAVLGAIQFLLPTPRAKRTGSEKDRNQDRRRRMRSRCCPRCRMRRTPQNA